MYINAVYVYLVCVQKGSESFDKKPVNSSLLCCKLFIVVLLFFLNKREKTNILLYSFLHLDLIRFSKKKRILLDVE